MSHLYENHSQPTEDSAVRAVANRVERKQRRARRVNSAAAVTGLLLLGGILGSIVRSIDDAPSYHQVIDNTQNCDMMGQIAGEPFANAKGRVIANEPGELYESDAAEELGQLIQQGACGTEGFKNVAFGKPSCLENHQMSRDGRSYTFECLVPLIPLTSMTPDSPQA